MRGLSKFIVALTALSGIGSLLALAVSPSVADRAGEFLDGSISEDDFLESYGPLAIAQLLQGVATIAIAVLTMIWMFRMASNARLLGRSTFWHPSWAVFGWFLPPFVLYVIPFLMLRELWKASSSEHPAGGDDWRSAGGSPALWVWFVLFGLAPTVLAAIQFDAVIGGGFGGSDAEDVAELVDEFGAFEVATGVVGALGAVAWIVVVLQLTARHRAFTREP